MSDFSGSSFGSREASIGVSTRPGHTAGCPVSGARKSPSWPESASTITLLRTAGTRAQHECLRFGPGGRGSRTATYDTERNHFFALAKPARHRPRTTATQCARPGLLRALENVADIPALLLGHRLDLLATNRLACALYLDFDALPAPASGTWRATSS
ncbi:MmyB family transcriptional regulator [Streptomyces sp. NBC_01763]|uniref:MmyB family transcriptional regulator n=1 Tax=Streptomyces sp. NBC_01763 TaxID=2975934 RepID=UPI002DDBF2D2|nr:hypothetical protein [Streptomyces sp. NBC_01763]